MALIAKKLFYKELPVISAIVFWLVLCGEVSLVRQRPFINQSIAAVFMTGPLESVSPIAMRPEWNRFKILVWPYHTDVLKDYQLYRKLALGGFQIDRGAGQNEKIEFSIKQSFPYYAGHAADKGFLYLKGEDAKAVTGKTGLIIRPNSLADTQTIIRMKEHLLCNINATKNGFVLAYAFDDEISLGRLTSPGDVDIHPLSLKWFRVWLAQKYRTTHQLNSKWGTTFKGFLEVIPQGFEEIRRKNKTPPLSGWNLSPWMDFRHFMDFQFSAVLMELTRYANCLDPCTPAGFVGGQGPGPWGGYDYAMLSRSVQWMEAYDINGTNEILRSFWNKERRPRMQTFFAGKNPKLESWFLWYYLLHGNQAVIAWPDGWFHTKGDEIDPDILALEDVFKEIQGEISEPIVNQKTIFDPDPIGIYYSHPSIQAGWAMDAAIHGKTWINRKSSIDNENQTKGILRMVWCKTLEDLGYQYDFVSYLDVEEGIVDLNQRFKVIILPKTVCLSDLEAEKLRQFVKNGGTLIADYLCGMMDEHGKGRVRGVLDELFGIIRDESKGYLNGKCLSGIDGEKFRMPFLERFSCNNGSYRYGDIVVFERGTRHKSGTIGIRIKGNFGLFHTASVLITGRTGKGQTVYCNLSPLEYWAPTKRFGCYGTAWRKIVSGLLSSGGLEPRVVVYENGNSVNMIECLYWENSGRHYLGLVKNPTDGKDLRKLGVRDEIEGITGNEIELRMEFKKTVTLINLRNNVQLGVGRLFHDRFKPWEGNLYEVLSK